MRLSPLLFIPLLVLSACGSRFEPSDEYKRSLFKEPTDVITPTKAESITDGYSVYRLVEARVGADTKAMSVSAQVTVESTAGQEIVDLVGVLRPDGSASLVDVNPLPDTKNRLVAEALCVDAGVCSQIILNVYYNVEGQTFKRQFSSDSLRAADAEANGSTKSSAPVDAPKTKPAGTPDEPTPASDVDEAEDALHPAEKKAPTKADASDTTLGDYVGAPRNEILIGRLWPRSKSPELPPVLSRADDPSLKPSSSTAKSETESRAQTRTSKPNSKSAKVTPPKPTAGIVRTVRAHVASSKQQGAKDSRLDRTLPKVTNSQPQPSAETKGFITRWISRVEGWLSPKEKTQLNAPTKLAPAKPNSVVKSGQAMKPRPAAKPNSAAKQSPEVKPGQAAKPNPAKKQSPAAKPNSAKKPGPAMKPNPVAQPEPIPATQRASQAKPVPAPMKHAQSLPEPPATDAAKSANDAPSKAAAPTMQPPPQPQEAQNATDAKRTADASDSDDNDNDRSPEPSTVTTSPYPFPPAKPDLSASPLDQKITLLEARLAPLMNLRDGGVARGGYTDSRENGVRSAITKASPLSTTVEGLVPVQINHSAHWGTGMLVSFLENAANYLFKQLGLKLYVGDMSLKNGGAYGNNSSHHTHRNGLDADLAWIGWKRPLRDSALDEKGNVVDGFDYEKTWNFLKLASRQEIVEDAQKTSALSRVFMSPAIKSGFCEWAKEKGHLENPHDAELMRLVRPTDGHYKHFHLSLKCSPHYPLCRNLAGLPPPGPGCD